MVSKKDKDAESGLQVLSILSIIWTIGFFYFSQGETVLGINLGKWPFVCCSTLNVLLIILFLATWISTRKENRVKTFLDEHFKINNSISVDEIASKFEIKKGLALRILNSWNIGTGMKGEFDGASGLFSMKETPVIEPSSPIEGNDVDDL